MAEYAPKYCELADDSPSYGGVAWITNDTFDLKTFADNNSDHDSGKPGNTPCNLVVPMMDTDFCFGDNDPCSDQEPLA